MGVRRGYLIALGLAIVVAVAGVITTGNNGGGSEAAQLRAEQAAQALATRHLPAAMAALQGLRVPGNFRLRTTGCHWYRCYVVPQPTPQVAPVIPAIMRSIGADNPKTRRLAAAMGALIAPFQSEVVLKHLGIRSKASRIDGCTTTFNPRHGVWVHCAEPAVIDDNVVDVFLAPYLDCPTSPAHCRWTNQTEVDITQPSGAPGTARG